MNRKSITKKELARALVEGGQVSSIKAGEEVITSLFATIRTELCDKGSVFIQDFGRFNLVERAPKKARNPKTGETVMVPARLVVTFTPASKLTETIPAL